MINLLPGATSGTISTSIASLGVAYSPPAFICHAWNYIPNIDPFLRIPLMQLPPPPPPHSHPTQVWLKEWYATISCIPMQSWVS